MATRPYNRDVYGLSEPITNVQQAPIKSGRNPQTNDRAQIGTEWINNTTNSAWILTSIEDNISTWVDITSGSAGATTFDTDSGTAITSANVITLHGTGDVTTSGSGSTVTIAGAGVTTVNSGSGTATASSNAITIAGGTGINTTATGSTVTVSSSGALAATFDGDTGSATPSAGVITMHGAGDITTSATSHTVTFTGSGANTFHSESGTATAASNAITIAAGTGITTSATGSTVTITATGAGDITTITGDQGSATTSSSVAIETGYNSGSNSANGTPQFVVNSTSSTLQFNDSSENVVIGPQAGYGGWGSGNNVGLGSEVFHNGGVSATYNVAIGTNTMDSSLTNGSYNVAIGPQCGRFLTTGSKNIILGYLAGNNYVSSESSNICINNEGTVTESNVLRIGAATGTSAQDLKAAYICGINGVDLSTAKVVTMASDQLGSTTLTAGSGISITPGSGIVTIAATGSGGIATIDGDSGSMTGSTVTISGGSTGLTTSASSATMDLTGTLKLANGGTNASLTASNGGIFYSTASAGAILAGTATAHQVLLSGSSTTPAWSTATYPATTTINQLLYSSANNVIGGVTAGDYGVLISSSSGVPSWLANGTTGQVLTATTSGTPSWSSAGSGTVTTIDGNSGSATAVAGVIIVNASTGEGTSRFSASGGTNTLGFSDSNNNTAIGGNSLSSLTSGLGNTIYGQGTAEGISSGSYNTIIGVDAGANYGGTESSNILINNGGTVSESNVLRIGVSTGTGTQELNAAYIAGIQTIVVTGTPVLVSSSDQLGVASSSQRFKDDIQTMTEESSALHKLRPVTFVWNRKSAPGLKDAPTTRQTGLIAEEVHQVMPNLVNVDREGKPFTVKYEELPALLLNEIQRLNKRIEALEAKALKKGKNNE